MKRLRKYLALSPAERRLILQAAAWHELIRGGLTILPFRTLTKILVEVTQKRCVIPDPMAPGPERIAWAVGTVGRFRRFQSSCLSQALTAYVLLRRKGWPAEVKIGVAKPGEQGLSAHAWVESAGVILVGSPEQGTFTAFPKPVLN